MSFLLSIAVGLASVSAVGSSHQFPPPTSIKSPDGNWQLVCKAPTNSQVDALYVLSLRDRQGGLFELRRVEGGGWFAFWSPDSARIAVTDRWASDRSDVVLCSVRFPHSGMSLAKLFPKNVIPSEEINGHCYFEAVDWMDSHRLKIRVFGHRDDYPANGFDYGFIFDCVSGGFKKITGEGPNKSKHRMSSNNLNLIRVSLRAASLEAGL